MSEPNPNETAYENAPSKFELEFASDGASLESNEAKITATFVFVENEERKILVMKNERGWDIPGGHLEDGEELMAATDREVMEEASVSIKDAELLAFIKNGPTAMAVFKAKPAEVHEFVVNEVDPTSDRTWMDRDSFMEVYSGGDKTMMRQLLDALA